MAEPIDPNSAGRDDELDSGLPQGYNEEAPEMEVEDAPRRAASARYIVDAEIGSEALMRDAMDPANQSLADALRLSFRVLQAVIIVLILLFLASGFKTVDDGYSGVKTVWGRIVAPLSPGPQFSLYPYPVGEFVTFKADNRTVDLGEYFSMASRGRPRDTMIESTEVSTPLNPGTDGSLITGDGDLSHLDVTAKYQVDQPIDFVHSINDADPRRDADEIVKMALRRAAVHVVGTMTVAEISDPSRGAELKENLRIQAQAVLDQLKCGIRLVDVTNVTGMAPFAIQKAMGAVQEAGVDAEAAKTEAEKRANQLLQNMAGGAYKEVIDMIEAYEDALNAHDEARSAELLASINILLVSDQITGEVSQIINAARSYRSQIDSTLGNEYRRFASLLPMFKQHPELIIRQQWLEAYASVLNRPDTEVVYVPPMLASLNLAMSGSADIQNMRNDARLTEKSQASNMANFTGPYVARGEEMSIDKAGRQLKRDPKTGKLVPMGTGN